MGERETKYCTKCSRFNNRKNYCYEFKMMITSICNADICSKYTTYSESRNHIKDTTANEIKKNKKVKCSNCCNRVFDDYCKKNKITIKNIRKQIECEMYIEKVL